MSRHQLIKNLEEKYLKADKGNFRIGDTVRVHLKIVEGEKERVQIFTGTVIARKGTGLSETFSVHRVAYGEGMERVFPLHSPSIVKIEVVKQGDVRRGKLYYLRGTSGKASKVKGLKGVRKSASTVPGESNQEDQREEQREEPNHELSLQDETVKSES